MKNKKSPGKLSLNKITIAGLEQKQLDGVRGGTLPTEMQCPTEKGCIPTRYTCDTCGTVC